MTAIAVQQKLAALASLKDAQFLRRFFKTGPGEYGEGDKFRGIRVPVLRKLAREYQSLSLRETVRLLKSRFHEDRVTALLILVRQYARGNDAAQARIYELYLKHIRWINNWDLVDGSAMHIVGAHLMHQDRAPLHWLARSKNLWERRIAIMSTFHFIRQGDFAETLALAKKLLHDEEDLIHKAVGWMLREVGNRNLAVEEAFLKPHCRQMPRTMLRYAIEKFPEPRRKTWLKNAFPPGRSGNAGRRFPPRASTG